MTITIHRKMITLEIGSFYLTEKKNRQGTVIFEIEPVTKQLRFTSPFQFTSEEEAIFFAKKLSKKYKRFKQDNLI